MPSSYTPSLRLTLPSTGELTGTWGVVVNTGITELLDSAVAGTASISTWGGAGVPYTLSNTDGAADEARKMFIVATGAPGEAKNVICPSVSKLYFFRNDTTGGFALTLKTSGGSGIAVPAGQYRVLYCNGTNVVEAFNALSSLTLGTALAVTSGGTGTTTSTGTGSVVLSNSPALTTPNLGIPSAATLTNATGLPLTTGVTGTLAASNGGTGQSAYTTGDLIYATGATTLAKLGIGSSTNVLTSSGSAPQWTAASSVAIGTATNIAGGTGGSVPYQSGAATTTFLGIGAANTVMTSSGTAPQWSTALTGLTGVSTTTATLSSDLTLSAGTANGVLYLNGSKVATSGSALTFDGSKLTVSATSGETGLLTATGVSNYLSVKGDTGGTTLWAGFGTDTGTVWSGSVSNHPVVFRVNNTEQMRLTSTGLLVGTTSNPQNSKLMVGGTVQVKPATNNSLEIFSPNSGTGIRLFARNDAGTLNRLELQGGQVIFPLTSGADGLYFDASSGNLGLGVTPSAWGGSGVRVIDVGAGASFAGSGSDAGMIANAYFNGTNWIYKTSSLAVRYQQLIGTGAHAWYTAPSGTAGNAISFTQAMTLDASGNLAVGTTSAATYRARIYGGNGKTLLLDNDASQYTELWFANNGTTKSVIGFNNSTSDIAFLNTATGGSLLLGTNGSERARLDSSGNLGLGVTPSAWQAGTKAIEIGASSSLSNIGTTTGVTLGANIYYDGGWKYKLSAERSTLYTQFNGAHSWSTAGTGTAGNAISFTQAMTLDASGNLGVGTTTAGGKLHVRTSAGAVGLILDADTSDSNSDSPVIDFRGEATQGQGCRIAAVNTSTFGRKALVFYTSDTASNTYTPTERARITSGGDLLVGKTTTGLGTVGSVQYSDGTYVASVAGSTSATTTLQIYSTGAAANRFYVDLAGTVFATNTTISAISDQRFKENIRDLDVGLNAIMALKPRKFDWKAGKGKDIKDDRGFIAQEFEQVFPDLIDEWKDAAPEGEAPYKSVRQDLIPVLVKAIQEQQAIIDSLKARLDAANL